MADDEAHAQERGVLLASLLMLCAALRETRDENAQLHEQLAARDRNHASLVDYTNRGWARVAVLSARTRRLLRLAKYWKKRCPKRPISDHLKAIMMARYAVLGGFEHGKGEGAAIQVAKEFDVSLKTVQRLSPVYARLKRPMSELRKIAEAYRRRYRD